MSRDSGINDLMGSLFLFHLTLKISSDFLCYHLCHTDAILKSSVLSPAPAISGFVSSAFIWFSMKLLFPLVAFGSLFGPGTLHSSYVDRNCLKVHLWGQNLLSESTSLCLKNETETKGKWSSQFDVLTWFQPDNHQINKCCFNCNSGWVSSRIIWF